MRNILIVIVLLSFCGYCYLPVEFNETPYYNATLNHSSLANETTIVGLEGVNLTCTSETGSTNYTTVNSSDYFYNDSVFINSTGSWNCTATAYNASDTETNETIFTITCPTGFTVEYQNICYMSIDLEIDQNTTYFDIGDNVTIWADVSNSTLVSEIWLYSSNGSTYNFSYSILRDQWYVFYTIKQAQEILIAQSFASGGEVTTGIGEMTITYNPVPQMPSEIERLWTQLGYYGALIFLGMFALVCIVIAGPIVIGFMLATVKGER